MDAKQQIEAWADEYQKGLFLRSRTCPRCGGGMRKRKSDNALSRVCNAYVCAKCGEDEAMLDYFSSDAIPFSAWHLVMAGAGGR